MSKCRLYIYFGLLGKTRTEEKVMLFSSAEKKLAQYFSLSLITHTHTHRHTDTYT